MRPLTLEFQAFGSYPGREVVDFGPLSQRGLFVVTGPTGSGKTTIFDAMAYALYGKLPGARASAGRERSDHASMTVPTSVVFEFETQGVRYRVERSPQQDVPKKNGQGTTRQQAKAHLVRLEDTGEESVATGASAVSEACERLVGLGSAEFQKVVLLPQGEFSRFLLAKDLEREELLRELFTGSLYGDTTKWLKEREIELYKEVAGVDQQVSHLRKSADAAVGVVIDAWEGLEGVSPWAPDEIAVLTDDELRALIAGLGPAAADLDGQCAAAMSAVEQVVAELATADGLAKRFDTAAGVRTTLAELAATENAVVQAAAAADVSAKARPVVAASTEVARRASDAERAKVAADALTSQLAEAFAAIGVEAPAFDATAVASAAERERAAVAEDAKLLKGAFDADSAAAEAEGLAAQAAAKSTAASEKVTAASEERDTLRSEIARLEPLAEQATATTTALNDAERIDRLVSQLANEVASRPGLADAAVVASAAKDEAMQRFVSSQAPRLAQSLVAGEPCAVCGSTEHPAPAVVADDEVADYETVTKAQLAADRARDALSRVEMAIAGLVDDLGPHADVAPEVAAERLEIARAAAKAAATAAADLAATRASLTGLESSLEADQALATQLAVAAASAQGAATQKRTEADRLAALCVGIDSEVVTAREAAIERIVVLSGQMSGVTEAVTTSATQLVGAQTALDSVLVANGFTSVEAATEALLSEQEETERREALENWKAQSLKAAEAWRVLEEQGIPAERPDTTTLEEAAGLARSSAEALAAKRTTGSGAIDTALARLDEAASEAAGSAELRERHETVRRAFTVCNGESPRLKVKLERWVLAHELDRVTRQANVHLERMTNHRYRLQRSRETGQGLTLEVIDAHNGHERPTGSLSGGEQFQASLALALGLADVISHGGTASGKQFEALFVDEGFGSLDPVALEQAIDALSMIQATGRMVGAITHVEGMKERLHVGIEVSRLPGDRGSTLSVHP